MKIEFMCNNITNLELIYHIENVMDEDYGEEVRKIDYVGTSYSQDVIEALKNSVGEIKKIEYRGQVDRIAKEHFDIYTDNEKYTIKFTFDTYNNKEQTKVTVSIETDDKNYDVVLEKIKIQIKDILIKNWKVCTWILDEQSEYLSIDLYGKIYAVENKIRAFVNNVLTAKLGASWINCIGFEKIVESYNKNKADFKRGVPEFSNINDILLSITIETLAWIIFKAQIYEKNIPINEKQNELLHSKLLKGNPNALFDYISNLRVIKLNVWDDIFKNYFPSDDFKAIISDFIKDRNHIAHNKLLTFSARSTMLKNIKKVDDQLNEAIESFTNNMPSDELCLTWQVEEEQHILEEEHWAEIIEYDTGVEIRTADQIFDLFDDMLHEIYTSIDDNEYFNQSVEITPIYEIENCDKEQLLFTIKSNIDETFNVSVYITLSIIDGMGTESFLFLKTKTADNSVVLDYKLNYYNGDVSYDSEQGCYIANTDSYFDKLLLHQFIEELEQYITLEMNPIKTEIDNKVFNALKDGGNIPIADFPCWNCNQNYISIDDSIYPFGKCANCGEENEIGECIRCNSIYMIDEGSDELCGYCYDKLLND